MNISDVSSADESNRSLLDSESTYLIPVSAEEETSPPRPLQLITSKKAEQLDQPGGGAFIITPDTDSYLCTQDSRPPAQKSNAQPEPRGDLVNELYQRKRTALSQKVNDSEEDTIAMEPAPTKPAATTGDQRKMKKAVRKLSGEKQQPQTSLKLDTRNIYSPALSDHSPCAPSEGNKSSSNPLYLPLTGNFGDDVTRCKAATMIQTLWRGWRTRNRDQRVRRLIQQLRTRRAEDHIRYLRSELDRVIQMYEEEKKLRTLQFEAIKYLWQEVKSLQKWQSQVTGVPVSGLGGRNGGHGAQTTRGEDFPVHVEDRTREVMSCSQLTQQVGQLQETVSTLTNYVFQGCITSSTPSDDGIVVSAVRDDSPIKNGSVTWECTDASPAEPAPPQTGVPPCPVQLLVRGLSDTSLILVWNMAENSQDDVIGYRVYVNDLPKAMLSSANRSARIEGLESSLNYSLYVRTVSPLGESLNSATLTVRRARSPDKQRTSREGKPPISRNLNQTSERLLLSDDSTPPHTPKIMTSHQRTRDQQPSSPESEDSNKENVLGEPVVQRKNRSLERFNNQIKVMPDKPEQMKKKSDEESSPRSGSDQQAVELRAATLVKRKERARSISLSEALGTEADESGVELLKKSSSSECVAAARPSLRSCSPSPSDSLPARASSKDTLLKVQQSITDKSQLQNEEEGRRVTIRRSSSLKSNPDRYRLSPTGQIAHLRRDSGSSDRAISPVILRDSSPETGADNEVAPSLMRGSSLKAKVNNDETSSGLRRSSSLKGNILPNRDVVFPDDLSRTLPAEFSPQTVQPIVREKQQGKTKNTTKSTGLLSKFKSKK